MATALYRRYRSQRFADLIGQGVIATTLRNEVRADSLAHAYLFAGIRGTGKTSTARILARAINCLEPCDGEPCNGCRACNQILDGSSVDVLEIDAASNRGIDEIRELREKVKYLPAALRTKVYIIDEAHMLTSDAWNAFLKTLEEPPGHVLFVLATTEPHKVPETVRSRVQRFDFRRVSAPDIAAHLLRVLESEQTPAEPPALTLLARAAQGSVRDALSMLDQSLAGGERPLTAAQVRRALGLADPSVVESLIEALAGADGAAALRAAAVAFDAGADPRHLLRETAHLARAAELRALGHHDDGLGDAEAELVAAVARAVPRGFWLRALELLQATELELRQPVDARLQVELCLMRLVHERSSSGEQLDALERRVAALEAVGTSHPGTGPSAPPSHAASTNAVTPSAPVPTASAPAGAAVPASVDAVAPAQPAGRSVTQRPLEDSAAEIPLSDAEERAPDASVGTDASLSTAGAWQAVWVTLIEAVSRQDKALAGVLRDCRALDADATSLTVGTAYSFHLEKLRDPTRMAILAHAVAELAGSPRQLSTAFCGEERPVGRRSNAAGETTRAVLEAFAGSRVTSTRIRDESGSAPRGGAA